MQSITKNFRLGFGSFVDKTVMPYVSTVPSKLAAPCDECAAPYSYKHHLDLTTNTDQFSVSIQHLCQCSVTVNKVSQSLKLFMNKKLNIFKFKSLV